MSRIEVTQKKKKELVVSILEDSLGNEQFYSPIHDSFHLDYNEGNEGSTSLKKKKGRGEREEIDHYFSLFLS